MEESNRLLFPFPGRVGEPMARQFVEIAIFVNGVADFIDLAFFQHNRFVADGAGNQDWCCSLDGSFGQFQRDLLKVYFRLAHTPYPHGAQ